MIIPHTVASARNVMLIFVVINGIFLLVVPLLPFIDLPNHLAEATIYKYYNEPGNVLAQYYKPAPWYFPNTFHPVFCSIFPDVETGNKIFHILCIVLLQGALFFTIRQLGGNVWYELLGMLLTYNYNLTYGFVGFAISIPTIIVLFYFTLREVSENRALLRIIISFLLILLFLMHAQNALFGLLLYAIMMFFAYRKSFPEFLKRILTVPLPLVILIFTWWFSRGPERESGTSAYLLDYYTSGYFENFMIRLRIVIYDNFQLRDGLPGVVIASVFFVCILLPLFWYKVWKTNRMQFFTSPSLVYAFIFFATALCCYLFLPDKLPGQTPLFQRFCTMVMLSFIILGSVLLKHVVTEQFRYFVIGIAACYMFFWFEYIYTFNRENPNFRPQFFNGIDDRSRLAGLIYDHQYRGRNIYIHFPNYFLVWNRGVAASKIIDYRFGVVRRVASEKEIPVYHELIAEHYKRKPQYAHLEFLLVRGSAAEIDDANLSGFSLWRQKGTWKLYRNRKDSPKTAVQHFYR